jgi:hypothetical protein
VVKSQNANLTPGPSSSHNLCFKCPNGSCELILDIYISIAFQWYKKLLNAMGFDPYDCTLNIQESIGTPTPKVGVPLGVWGVYSLTLFCTPENMRHDSWLPFLACNLATLCLGHKPNARVATVLLKLGWLFWLRFVVVLHGNFW